MAAQREERDIASYAIRVSGRLGPTLLSQLPCHTAVAAQARSVLLTRASSADLVEIARKLAQRGAEIDWVRQRPDS